MLVIMVSSTWQWHLHGWFCWFDAVRAVSFACRQAPLPSLHGRALRQLHGLAGFAGDNAHHVSVQALVVGSGTASRVLAWTRMLTCPLLCSTDARYRRAENCGAPQLQFVDQVESSLFGNRVMYAQCNCAVFSCQWWCLLDS